VFRYEHRPEVGRIGVFGIVSVFDDRVGSDTRSVSLRPGCGLSPYYAADIKPGEAAQR
jgi:hypothetical protein